MPILSIIIPIYNAKNYFNKCISSILAQTFTNYELILVNDGSSDGSGKLCDNYALSDSRIHVIHQKNQGVSAARNAGLISAKGNYICFIDADDWIEPDLLECCIKQMESTNADILQHGMTKTIWKNNKEVSSTEKYIFSASKYVTKTELANNLEQYFESISASIFNYIFKRDLLKNLFFDTDMPYSEDNLFAMQALTRANTYYFMNHFGYHYNVRAGSAAYKWQPKMSECYKKTFDATHLFLNSLNIPRQIQNSLLAVQYVNGYSSLIYNVCLPTCTLTYKEKKTLVKNTRTLFQIDEYKKYYSLKDLNMFSKLKTVLTLYHHENILLFLGTFYLKDFTNK